MHGVLRGQGVWGVHGRIWRAVWPLALLAAALGAGAARLLPAAERQPVPPGALRADLWPGPPAPATPAPAIGPGTRVRYRRLYRPCQEATEVEVPAPEALQGMTERDLSVYYPQWQVVSFSADAVVLAAETDEMCDAMRYSRHVRLDGDMVTVFWGTRDRPGPVLERTGIAAGDLDLPWRLQLEAGVDVADDAAVRALLQQIAERAEAAGHRGGPGGEGPGP